MQRPSGWLGQREQRGGKLHCGRPRKRSGWARRSESPAWSGGPGTGRRPDPETLLQEGWTSPLAPGWCDLELDIKRRTGKGTMSLGSSRLGGFLQQGAAEGASRVREKVSASLAADVRVGACFFESAREQSRCLVGWGFGDWGTVKCTSVESFLRWEASEGRVLFECKGGSKLITAIRNESQLVIDTGGHEFGDTMPLLQRKTIKLGGYFKLIFLYCK